LLFILTSVDQLSENYSQITQSRNRVYLILFISVIKSPFSLLSIYKYIGKNESKVVYAMEMVRVVRQNYVRSVLNSGQIKVLELVYKYRFVSRQLLANSLGVKPENGLYEKLEILVKNGYLGKRFDKQLKLQNVPAAYYLSPAGIRSLQALPGHEYIGEPAIRLSYQNKTNVSNDFIASTLSVYEHTQLLQNQYPGLQVFTKRDTGRYDYFPQQLPDSFLSTPSDDPEHPHRFFFDIVSDRQPRSVLDRRIANYVEFFDGGGWDETGSELPVILLLSEWGPAERRIQRSVMSQLSRLESDLRVFTSTTTAVEKVTADKAVWTAIGEVDELVALDDIPVNP
jgi:hypothetical protein